MRRFTACLLAAVLTAALLAPAAGASYTDIPSGSALAGEVQRAVDYGLMNGYSATVFGYGDSMTRAQFVTVLDRMLGWTASQGAHVAVWTIPAAMQVTVRGGPELSDAYLSAIESAAFHDVVDTAVPFRPNDPVTRGEMAEMLVRALGLKSAAAMAEQQNAPTGFTDVTDRRGYIRVACDIGMTNGTSATTFSPDATATRAQTAAMLVRVYEKLHQETDFLHGFYAISSHSQLDLAEQMDAVSAGWSRMTWDGTTAKLSTTSADGNEFAVPSGYDQVVSALGQSGVSLHLSVYMDASGQLSDMLASAGGRSQAAELIAEELTVTYAAAGKNPYSGVTIDFEGLRSARRADFTAFLEELSREVHALDKSLYVCVSPMLAAGGYYDGYDYRAIGDLADKVILMAYDYDARDLSQFVGTEYYKTAATAPIDQVYWSLRSAAEQMGDASKLVLGFSSKNVAWQIDGSGKLVSGTPVYPTNETVARRLAQVDTKTGWSDAYQQSYAVYTTEDGGRYFLWYQDDASVGTALNTGKLLGVTGVSIWRLGNIPQYTFHQEVLGLSQSWNWNSLLA